MSAPQFPFFEIEKNTEAKTATLWLNRPDKRNLLNWPFWMDLPAAVQVLEDDSEVRAVVVAGRGEDFSIGLDLKDFFVQAGSLLQDPVAEGREKLLHLILKMQEGFNKIHHGRKAYIAAVQGWCIGGGLDLASACDIRLATTTAQTSLRETRVAIVADMGSLQRLPRIIGQGNTRLMGLTGRDFGAEECQQMGLYSQLLPDTATLHATAQRLAAEIAANSPITVRGVKENLNYMESHSVEDGLKYVASWNAAFLGSKDLAEAVAAFFEKRAPRF